LGSPGGYGGKGAANSADESRPMTTIPYHYGEMTWPRVKEAAAQARVAVVPVATIEDHGLHLPIDTDVRLCYAACDRAVALVPDKAVLIPPVNHGYSPHHMDFPGPITIGWDTFIRYMLDVCKSLVAHGFHKILIVNGHGSNTPFVDIIARLTVVETGALAAAINYWNAPGVHEVAESLRESDKVGGMNHACEFETSIYLALRPDLVDMSKAVREIGHQPTKNYWTDLVAGDGPLAMMEHWSALSQSGVMGDPTKATAEKGERLLAAAAAGLAEIIDEMRNRRPAHRVDHH
jgi:creatinine amidohydrolase